ncbi:MAG: hypothetical protein KBC16_04005 [Candidatus Pacebacteria bacterium]|nr:hypothetical protein [Candidatus Paceibacterota bacterium]
MSIDPTLKRKAIELRLHGKSYSEIQRSLGVASKGTLSTWFRGLVLPPATLKLLETNIELATKRGLLAFNADRSARIKQENNEARDEGISLVDTLSKRELMLVGAALYWGEGTKSAGKNQTPRIVFTNSDPEMIKVFLRFVREALAIPDEKISGELHLYEDIDHDLAKEYWSEVTSIPVNRFWSTNLVSRASKGIRPTNRLPYGTLAIRIPGRTHFYKIQGLIKGLCE